MVASTFSENLSRLMLAMVCVTSGIQAFRLAKTSYGIYTPHLVFIGVWSLVWATGMLELAFPDIPIPGRFVREWLNAAAISTLAGWMAFVVRLHREKKRPIGP